MQSELAPSHGGDPESEAAAMPEAHRRAVRFVATILLPDRGNGLLEPACCETAASRGGLDHPGGPPPGE